MNFPAFTGTVSRALRVSEPRLNELLRRGKIDPAPVVERGRRLWQAEHVRQAAQILGRPNPLAEDARTNGAQS